MGCTGSDGVAVAIEVTDKSYTHFDSLHWHPILEPRWLSPSFLFVRWNRDWRVFFV